MKIRLFLLFAYALVVTSSFGQGSEQADGSRVISTAVPFLTISPDARSGGMGDVGVATTPDAYSMFWNPAKYAFIDKTFGFGIGYVPWLRSLVNDIGLASVTGFWKIGDKQAVAASLRYFSMGAVMFTDNDGKELGEVKPNEWAIDATYSRKFSREFSGAVAGRFVRRPRNGRLCRRLGRLGCGSRRFGHGSGRLDRCAARLRHGSGWLCGGVGRLGCQSGQL